MKEINIKDENVEVWLYKSSYSVFTADDKSSFHNQHILVEGIVSNGFSISKDCGVDVGDKVHLESTTTTQHAGLNLRVVQTFRVDEFDSVSNKLVFECREGFVIETNEKR